MIERRFLPAHELLDVQVRGSGGITSIRGYSAVFYSTVVEGTEFKLYEGAVERIGRHAFDRAISEKHDVRCLYNHDANFLLGRTANGTCALSVDPIGLRYDCLFNRDDIDHQRVVAKIERGDLTGSSFAFRPKKVSWSKRTDGTDVRTVEDLVLYDVGPVTYPAYEASTSFVRAEIEAERAICLQSPGKTLELGDDFTAFKRSLNWVAIKREQLQRLIDQA